MTYFSCSWGFFSWFGFGVLVGWLGGGFFAFVFAFAFLVLFGELWGFLWGVFVLFWFFL